MKRKFQSCAFKMFVLKDIYIIIFLSFYVVTIYLHY